MWQRFKEWRAWHKRERTWTNVATHAYKLTDQNERELAFWVVTFVSNGNGKRSVLFESCENAHKPENHNSFLTHRMDWIVHGHLPENAKRVAPPKTKLTVIK